MATYSLTMRRWTFPEVTFAFSWLLILRIVEVAVFVKQIAIWLKAWGEQRKSNELDAITVRWNLA